jgi:HEAT repeat protein
MKSLLITCGLPLSFVAALPAQNQGGRDDPAATKVYAPLIANKPALTTNRGAAEWFRNWEMEQRVGQSQLILVVRVSNVSALTVVHGAKVSTTYREYRFQPVRRLKGVFTRDELPMTSSDLGLPEADGSQVPPIQQGELRLLLLMRTADGGFTCPGAQPNVAQNPDQLVPKLRAMDDPIVGMTETLIRVTESPSRKERAALLIKQLDNPLGPDNLQEDLEDPSVVPLLKSLSARALWAGETPAAAVPLVRYSSRARSPAVRSAAAQTLERVLAAGSLSDDSEALAQCAEAMRRLLESDDTETAVRVAALRAVGHTGEFGRRLPWSVRLLVRHLEQPRTYAERTAAASALADLDDPRAADAVLAALERVPLDEPLPREHALIDAAVRLAGDRAAPLLARRLERKLSGEHYAPIEIAFLGQLKFADALPAIVRAAISVPYRVENEAGISAPGVPGLSAYRGWTAFHQQQMAVAYAFGQLKDPRAVPVLVEWLRDPNQYLRGSALAALTAIGDDAAVAAVRLRLKAEPDLSLKLRMATMLGRHGLHDGYAFAIEHVADPGLTEIAVESLGSIREERTRDELWKILETSHDRRWNSAALAGLVAVGDPKVKDRLFGILKNSRDPLLADVLAAAGQLGDADALPLLVPLVASRNQQVAYAALRTVGKLAAAKKVGREPARQEAARAVVTAVLALLSDPDADQQLRIAALDTARQLDDPRIRPALRSLADQAELEGSQLLPRVEQELRRAAPEPDGEKETGGQLGATLRTLTTLNVNEVA